MENTVLTQHQTNILYTILAEFEAAARAAYMPYAMSSGTALGAVRHGGLIPWDDDGDLYVTDYAFYGAETALMREAARRGLRIEFHTFNRRPTQGWYKIFLGSNKFPNVDLFLLRQEQDGVWRLANELARKWWPKEALTDTQIKTIKRVPFGPLSLPIFSDPESYLTRSYGADWGTVAWDGYDHVNEKTRPYRANERVIQSFRPYLPTSLVASNPVLGS
jgi:phosphorylcholine metabolism protein LicD